MIRHLDLFSGIGGFALAVRWLGGQTVGFCEIEDYPQRVLRKNFPGVPIHDDIRTLTGATVDGWGGCDLITGGFPCQPFSLAGHRRGNEDDRALWPEMARIIDECRPTYVLGENVPGFVSVALDETLTHLESLGYAARAVAIPAVATDALHIRERIWIMGCRDTANTSGSSRRGEAQRETGFAARGGEVAPNSQSIAQREPAAQADTIATTGQARAQFGGGGEHGPDDHTNGVGRLRPDDEIRTGWHPLIRAGGDDGNATTMHGSSIESDESNRNSEGHVHSPESAVRGGGGWTPEPPFRRMAYGVPNRVDRLRGLGNAIVPAVAYEVLRVMLANELEVA